MPQEQTISRPPSLSTAWATVCSSNFQHRVWWSDHVLEPGNQAFAEAMEDVHGHCVAFIDSGVAQYWPNLARQLMDSFASLPGAGVASTSTPTDAATNHYLQANSNTTQTGTPLLAHVETIPGGDACKDGLRYAQLVAQLCFEYGVDRHGAVLAIGGGAVLDAVGLGAALTHRGVRLIRVPTTTLSQDDSAMGVKCGVNMFGQKNALGCFAAPWAILCDEHFLSTLPVEHWLGGFSEVVKIALLKDASLFDQLEAGVTGILSRDMSVASPLLRRCAWLHREHIVGGGDPFESGSSRPLDHGHWSAHRLEALSEFALPHGQAVAIGIALDACIGVEMGLLPAPVRQRIIRLLQSLRLPIWHPLLASGLSSGEEMLAGLEQFRQHIGGPLAIPLLADIGKPRVVAGIGAEVYRRAVRSLRTLAT